MKEREALKLALEALKNLPGFLADVETAIMVAEEALAQPEQEPVAFMDKGKFEHLKKNNAVLTTVTSWGAFDDDVALYTTTPQRTWVGLTDDEINEWTPEIHVVVRAIEAKLKEKNNG